MANFVVKADINGVEKEAEVVGKQSTPIATFDDVAYYHKINVADLDTSKMYDLEGNELESTPSEGYFILYDSIGPGNAWQLEKVEGPHSISTISTLSNGASSYGARVEEGAIENLDTLYLANAYVKLNEDQMNATLYFNKAGEGSITGPVSYEELNTELAKKQDRLTAGEGINITANNVISAVIEKGLLKTHDLQGLTITYNELVEVFGDASIGIIRQSSSIEEPYLFIRGFYKNAGVNKPTVVFIHLNLGGKFKYVLVEDNQKDTDLFTLARNYCVVPGIPSDTTKTYVLKLVNGAMRWVEETAS